MTTVEALERIAAAPSLQALPEPPNREGPA
jgi:hypothetical protein